jgi:hypothetical protein
LLAVPDSLVTVAGFVVALVVIVLVVVSLRSRQAGGRFDVSPPHTGEPDDRKPHD